uniref:Uncharacterized protein n=1 Tax=Catagonus wagneri TaxID=51154 RepID=A0A8C3YMX7_9CETA
MWWWLLSLQCPRLYDRYFTHWYKADVKGKPCEDRCILQHSNRICVITLAGSHPVLQSGKTIKSISYQISTKCSRLQNKVSGKFKRGAQFLTEFAPLNKPFSPHLPANQKQQLS